MEKSKKWSQFGLIVCCQFHAVANVEKKTRDTPSKGVGLDTGVDDGLRTEAY